MARSLDQVLFEAMTCQLDSKGVVVRTGTLIDLIDATVIAAATATDDETRCEGHRRKSPVIDYNAQLAADADDGVVRSVVTKAANVSAGRMLTSVRPKGSGEIYAYLAYTSAANQQEIRTAGR